ncbi:YegS/Rv2252/BmrU family lipid kinase [Halobacillus litoralis]|uniref:YegS/Rv2252/BmrU family lipid kinase n=1 Tax=Halobacillus litoralis TaxID=45668 RepID=UPI001CD23BAD|nr:YegS/Rv2252/BmrU family lipid kinase [Halobacillus litoralis]MCA0972811.1 YegS/Rv2252/BmrU family lipid kinase [Halobacillus litoralis]
MARFEKGVLIYNGNEEANEIDPQLSQTLPVIAQAVQQLTVIQTQSLDHLKEVCQSFGSEVDIFIILGGDGTIHECINYLAELEKRPVIGVLPGGTCNDFSRMLDMPQNLQQAAQAIVDGEEQQIDAGLTENGYFMNFWGIGLVTKTSFNIDENQKQRFGVLSYFISALKTVNQADPFEFKITVDGETMEGEAVMVLVMNGRFIGTRPLPVQSIQSDDGQFDVLIVKNSNLTLFKELMTMSQPGTDESRFQELHHKQGKKIRIEVDAVEDIDMDGEIKGNTPAELEVLPGHFTFINGQSGRFGPLK